MAYTLDTNITTSANVSQIWTTLSSYQYTLKFTLPNATSSRKKLILDTGLYLINNNFAQALASTTVTQQLGTLMSVGQSLNYSSIGKQDGDQDDFQALADACYLKDHTLTELHDVNTLKIVGAAVDFLAYTSGGYPDFKTELTAKLLPFFQAAHQLR